MNLDSEMKLFKRYTDVYSAEDNAEDIVSAIHLARQLEQYISPDLDLGWIIRCILDVGSQNLYTNSRGEATEETLEVHPEYHHAKLILRMCTLFRKIVEGEKLPEEKLEVYRLSDNSKFFYGEDLTKLNSKLLSLVSMEEGEGTV